jgi:hypothetical protein
MSDHLIVTLGLGLCVHFGACLPFCYGSLYFCASFSQFQLRFSALIQQFLFGR